MALGRSQDGVSWYPFSHLSGIFGKVLALGQGQWFSGSPQGLSTTPQRDRKRAGQLGERAAPQSALFMIRTTGRLCGGLAGGPRKGDDGFFQSLAEPAWEPRGPYCKRKELGIPKPPGFRSQAVCGLFGALGQNSVNERTWDLRLAAPPGLALSGAPGGPGWAWCGGGWIGLDSSILGAVCHR